MPRLDNTLFMRLLQQKEQAAERAREDQYRSLQAVGSTTRQLAAQTERDKIRRREEEYRRQVDAKEQREKDYLLQQKELAKHLNGLRTTTRVAVGKGESPPSSSDPEEKRAIALGILEGKEDFRERIKFEDERDRRKLEEQRKSAQEGRAASKEDRTAEETEYEISQRPGEEKAARLARKLQRARLRYLNRQAREAKKGEGMSQADVGRVFDDEVATLDRLYGKELEALYRHPAPGSRERKRIKALQEQYEGGLRVLGQTFPGRTQVINELLQNPGKSRDVLSSGKSSVMTGQPTITLPKSGRAPAVPGLEPQEPDLMSEPGRLGPNDVGGLQARVSDLSDKDLKQLGMSREQYNLLQGIVTGGF